MADEASAVDWRPVVAFPDESPSFVHGVEFGMLYRRMETAEPTIEATVHDENREVIGRAATHQGYKAEFKSTEVDGWAVCTLTKRWPVNMLLVVPQ